MTTAPICPMCGKTTVPSIIDGLWVCSEDRLTVNEYTGLARAMRRRIAAKDSEQLVSSSP